MGAFITSRKNRKIFWILGAITLLAFFAGANWCYHVFHKPSEIVGIVDSHFYKTPKDTWQAYNEDFKAYATPIVTPEFLAALAQNETHGNTIARTFWRWNFATTNPFEIYAPASSAVGLMQMTDGTFEVARHYCVKDGQVYMERKDDKDNPCPFAVYYNRLVPSHSIEMTSAYLHLNVIKALRKMHAKKVSVEKKRDLAAVIHLCGTRRGEIFVRHKFKFHKGEKCGSFDEHLYVSRVRKLEKSFKSYKRSLASN